MPTLFQWGRRSLSRKRIVSVVFLLLVVMSGAAAAVVVYRNVSRPEEKQLAADSTKIENTKIALANRDTDADGLQDWEEALYRSDPNEVDSDGDGAKDGEEVRASRDPAKKGPNDPLDQPAVNDVIADRAADDDGNLTFNFAQQLLGSGVLNGISADGELIDTSFLERLELPSELDPMAVLDRVATISTKDIIVAPTNDAEAVRNYFNAVYAIYARRLVPLPRDDLTILSEVLEREDYARLAELDVIIAALDRSIDEIKKIPVPSGYQNFAIAELNHLRRTKRAIEVLRRLQEDPIAAIVMLQKRADLWREIEKTYAETEALLAKHDIVFSTAEGGYKLFH